MTVGFILTSIKITNHFDKSLVSDELTVVRGTFTTLIVVAKKNPNIHLGYIEEGLASKIRQVIDQHRENVVFSCNIVNGHAKEGNKLPLLLGITAKIKKGLFINLYYQLLLKGCYLTLWEDEFIETPPNLYKVVDICIQYKRWLEPLNVTGDMVIKGLSLIEMEDLGWLDKMENNTFTPPPFWQLKTGVFTNVLTNNKRYDCHYVKGGIYIYENKDSEIPPISMVFLIAIEKNSCVVNDAPQSKRTDFKIPTLIVCLDKESISKWESQLRKHLKPNALKWCEYSNISEEQSFQDFDIVFTCYNDLANDAKIQESYWWRVILDSGHDFTHSFNIMKALKKLKARARWVLFRGPSRIVAKELAQIVAFLRIEPIGDEGYWEKLVREGTEEGNVNGLYNLQILVGMITLRRTAVDGNNIENGNGTVGSRQATST